MRGIGNSFQPAIVASRFDLMNCDIAPSAKITDSCRTRIYIRGATAKNPTELWVDLGYKP